MEGNARGNQLATSEYSTPVCSSLSLSLTLSLRLYIYISYITICFCFTRYRGDVRHMQQQNVEFTGVHGAEWQSHQNARPCCRTPRITSHGRSSGLGALAMVPQEPHIRSGSCRNCTAPYKSLGPCLYTTARAVVHITASIPTPNVQQLNTPKNHLPPCQPTLHKTRTRQSSPLQLQHYKTQCCSAKCCKTHGSSDGEMGPYSKH